MARVAPASDSFWAMPQAMLRLLARPKTTATLPLRSIIVERVPFRYGTGCDLEDSSRDGLVLSLQEIALAGGENDRCLVGFEFGLVKEDSAAVPACVLGVVESLVGTGEERTCDFASSGLSEADADGKRDHVTRNRKLAYRLFDPRGDGEGF